MIAEKESDRHDRPVIVAHSLGARIRPNRGCQRFPQVPEAVHVGIVDDLGLIVIDVSEIIPEDASIRQSRKQQENSQRPRPSEKVSGTLLHVRIILLNFWNSSKENLVLF